MLEVAVAAEVISGAEFLGEFLRLRERQDSKDDFHKYHFKMEMRVEFVNIKILYNT